MRCVLAFGCLNDIVFTKYDREFCRHVNAHAEARGLVPPRSEGDGDRDDAGIAEDVIMQTFSPLVTSQRIMSCQFGNSYTSCQCEGDLNVAFEEYMGYTFVAIDERHLDDVKRLLGVCVSFVRHLCGADVSRLRSNEFTKTTLTRMLDAWTRRSNDDQALLVEAIEQLQTNTELNAVTLRALQESADKLRAHPEYSKMHSMILVQDKLLSLYSSRNAQQLSAADILFIVLMCTDNKPHSDQADSEQFFSPTSSPQHTPTESTEEPISHHVMLMGNDSVLKCVPHALHVRQLAEGVRLVVAIELSNTTASSGLYEAFLYSTTVQTVQVQRDVQTLRPAFENLDVAIRKTADGLKKYKNSNVESCHKKLLTKWDFTRKKYQEFIKSSDSECLLRAESSMVGLLELLRELLMLTSFDPTSLTSSTEIASEAAAHVGNKLNDFNDFLRAKALKNLSLGSKASLTINKYLEEFPGLVHFIYVDRTKHRVTAPSLDFNSEETMTLTKNKIWSMVKFSRRHLQQGHLSLMWKDTVFNYSYFTWFEDQSGSPIKPKVFPTNSTKALPPAGIICGDFYKKLIEVCFPKMLNRVRCYELFCIHLGLATSSCVLEHTRRLAATVWEITGLPNAPIEFL